MEKMNVIAKISCS